MGKWSAEVAVIGGGPAGLTAAIAMARAGVATALVSKRPTRADHRTTALLLGSVTALDTLGVWTRCRAQAAPLRAMRIVDDTGRLLRAPEITFNAAEIGFDAFGYNIENRHLLAALDACAAELGTIARIDDEAIAVDISENGVTVRLGTGDEVTAHLLVGADGRRSLCRTAAGIKTDGQSYPQTALTFNLGHTRTHDDISTEFHSPMGPFTLVPLPGLRSSLVYVTDTANVRCIEQLDAGLAEELERRAHSILGKFTVEPGCGAFPLVIETARSFALNRVALVGEAGHVLPPIGAQGLNLGLRDAATIAEVVIDAHRDGVEVGAASLLARYDALRRSDVAGRTLAVDLLNRSLLSDFLPLQGTRLLGFFLLQHFGPLRRAIMREGIAPAGLEPRLMRGETL
jgi:2-octaprenyl-6-methoxyphenol hydroxylase